MPAMGSEEYQNSSLPPWRLEEVVCSKSLSGRDFHVDAEGYCGKGQVPLGYQLGPHEAV